MKTMPSSFKRPLRNTVRLYGLIKNRKLIWQMLIDSFKGDYRLSFFTIIAMIASFVYIIFPLDILPDFIPVVGWIDDGVVIYFLTKRLLREAERYLKFKEQRIVIR